MDKRKKINLALQGGGTHGAFTWGILDRFLETKLFSIDAITATSAGSMNAIVLAQGMIENGEDGARQLLHRFWTTIGQEGELTNPQMPLDCFLLPYLKVPLSFFFYSNLMNFFSPYQLNFFNYHPLRDILAKIIDIDIIKSKSKIDLFICATNIESGKIHIFKRNELSIDAILASACLPKIFQAVEVDHTYYWDGGYLGNPAIFPLIYESKTRDIIILHTVPMSRTTIPTTTLEIDTRLREISFNSSLMREMRAIAFVTKLIDEKWIKKEYADRLKRIRMHCLRADQELKDFSLASIYQPNQEFILRLHHLGRRAADNWLNMYYDSIGKHGTVNFNDWL